MDDKSQGQQLADKLGFTIKNCWESVTREEREAIARFAQEYKTFLDGGKTEWLFVQECLDVLLERGFVDAESLSAAKLPPGAKVYQKLKDKSLIAAVIGERPLDCGINIIGAHVDSPRIDLKTNPLYEDSELAFLDTRYYGGIKYYQWTAMPLAMYGRVIQKDGSQRQMISGGNDGESVFTITDLLPHLAREQMKKNAAEFIAGEELDILAGSEPFKDDKAADKTKLNALNFLHQKYGMTEKDFANAEITFVPAYNARDVGFDGSMIGAYGHDDRSCAYTAFQALLSNIDASPVPGKTCVCFLTDKEEVAAHKPPLRRFRNFIRLLCARNMTAPDEIAIGRVLENSRMLSADVNAAYDPNYADVYDKKTASFLGKGIAITRSGTGNFADMAFCRQVLDIFDDAGVRWQFGDLGKVGKGGGGTIARDFAALGMEVLDCGIPVLSMHSPFEVISKIDLWTAFRGYAAFFRGGVPPLAVEPGAGCN